MDILRIQTMRFSVSNGLKVCTEERSKLPKCIAEIGALTFQFTKVLDFSIFFGVAVFLQPSTSKKNQPQVGHDDGAPGD